MQKLAKIIEALLFVLGEPVSKKRLADLSRASLDDVVTALKELEDSLAETGIRLTTVQDTVGLATAPETSKIVSDVMKEEFSGDLSKAALEALAIIAYRGPLVRSEIDYIRGVNSTFTLRNLLVRGLVERVPNPKDARSYLYQPPMDLLKYFGVSRVEDLPDYVSFKTQMVIPEEKKEEGESN